MKKYLRMVRNNLIIDFWDKNKAEFSVTEIGEMFALKTTSTWDIINESNKKDPNRFIRKHIMRSHKKITKI